MNELTIALLKRIWPYAAGICVCGGLFIYGDHFGTEKATKERNEYYTTIITKKDLAQSRALSILQAEKMVHDKADEEKQVEIDTKYKQGIQNEQDKANVMLAGYRNGTLSLRDRFKQTCNASTGQPNVSTGAETILPDSSTVGSSGNGAQGSGLQGSDVELLVQFSAEADQVVIQLQSCQAVIAKDQETINGK